MSRSPASAARSRAAPAPGAPALRLPGPARFWSVTLPRFLDPFAPALATAFADGAWTAAWPPVCTWAPPAALLIGLLAPFVKPQMQFLFTESLVFTALVIAGAIVSGPVGVMLFLGYAMSSPFARSDPSQGAFHAYGPFSGEGITRYGASLLAADLLLAMPAFLLPLAARALVLQTGVERLRKPMVRGVAWGMLFPAACAGLIFLWGEATTGLLRPVFTLLGAEPTYNAVAPVQTHGALLAGVAAAAAVARLLLEAAARHSGGSNRIAPLERERRRSASPGGLAAMPAPLRVLAVSAVATLLLAGAFEAWWDAVVVFAGAAAVSALGQVSVPWGRAICWVPSLLRFALATLAAFGIAGALMHALWESGGMRAVMIAALASWVPFALLFPRSPRVGAVRGPCTPAEQSAAEGSL